VREQKQGGGGGHQTETRKKAQKEGTRLAQLKRKRQDVYRWAKVDKTSWHVAGSHVPRRYVDTVDDVERERDSVVLLRAYKHTQTHTELSEATRGRSSLGSRVGAQIAGGRGGRGEPKAWTRGRDWRLQTQLCCKARPARLQRVGEKEKEKEK